MNPDTAMAPPHAPTRLSPALRWALGASAVASSWAIWWPQSVTVPQAMHAVAPKQHPQPPRSLIPAPDAAASKTDATLSPASRDPFQLPQPPPPPAAQIAAAKAAAEATTPPPPPPPAAPPMTHRVFGSIQDPDGRRLVFLVDGTQSVLATEGAALSTGYAVKAVTDTEIRLRHPLAEQDVTLPLPAANSR